MESQDWAEEDEVERLVWLVAALSLAGCDMLEASWKSLPDKVNEVFPLSEEVEIARGRLVTAFDGDKAAQAQVASEIGQLVQARAVACSAGTGIGRFDTPRRIRAKITETSCFQEHDAKLGEWIGLRRLALLLGAPPLVPAEPLPPRALLPYPGDYSFNTLLAERANVLVMRNWQQQKFVALQLPSGKEISRFTLPEPHGRQPSLSPNGRLLAAGWSKGLRVVDVASGQTVWSTDKYRDVIAWAPEAEFLVASQVESNAPQLLDLRGGRAQAYPAPEKSLSWSVSLGESRMLLGSQNSATLMQHSRESNGTVAVTPLRQWQFASGSLSSGVTPMLVNQGRRLVYPTSSNDLAWIELETGQQGVWAVSSLRPSNFAKVGDHLVAFDVHNFGGAPVPTRVIDTQNARVAEAKDFTDRDGQLVRLTPRTGYMKRGPSGVTFGSAMEVGEAHDIERYLAEVLLAKQMEKLREPGAFLPGTASARHPSGLVGTPVVQNIPVDAKVSIVGVYESGQKPHRPGASRQEGGPVVVNVGPGSTPLVLVLASYEKVNWIVRNGANRRIAAVLLSGYEESNVSGQGAVQVIRIGRHYAYDLNSDKFTALQREVARYVGNAMPAFQGRYSGSEFAVQ